MNKTLKLATVALATLGFASCSNDDFFGQSAEGFSKDQVTLEVTVEAPNGTTRANAYGTEDKFDWVSGDELRVYDNLLQKYDNFVFMTAGSSKAFVRMNEDPNPQYVDTYVDATDATKNAYALFGGGDDESEISYSGWKQGGTTGTPVALVYVPAELNHSEATVSNDAETNAYKASLPLWGRVSAAATENAQFSAELNWLTAYAKLTFENANKLASGHKILKVRARALKWTDAYEGLDDDHKAALKKFIARGVEDLDAQTNVTEIKKTDGTSFSSAWTGVNVTNYYDDDDEAPLWGWFDAALTEGGIMTDAEGQGGVEESLGDRNILTIDVATQMIKGTSVVYMPIMVQDYDLLLFEYQTEEKNTSNEYKWIVLSKYTDKVAVDEKPATAAEQATSIWRGARFAPSAKEFENSSNVFDGTNTLNITEQIQALYGDGSKSVIINFNTKANGDAGTDGLVVSSGVAAGNTIYLPKINKDLTININGTSKTTMQAADLTIADLTGVDNSGATGKVTINFITGFTTGSAAKSIKVATKAPVVLAGDYTVLTTPVKAANDDVKLTLGVDDDTAPVPFTHKTDLALTIDKGALTVANAIDNATTPAPAHSLKLTYTANKALVVSGAIDELTVAATAASANVNALVGTSITTSKNITIKADNVEFPLLTLNHGVTRVDLNGGILTDIQGQGTDGDTKWLTTGDNKDAVTVASTGLSAIRKSSLGTTASFTSSFDVPTGNTAQKFVDAFDASATTGYIYTAAQLAAVGETTNSAGKAGNQAAFVLKTNITGLTNWTSPNLNKAFNGAKAATNGLTIAGVDAPLFGTVTANISNVDLAVNISKTDHTIGALAKETSDAAVVVQNVAIAGSIGGQNKVGGVFGITGEGTVTFGATTGTDAEKAAAKVVVNVTTFTNTTSVAANFNGSLPTYGTFGKFIGQAGAGAVTITPECTRGTEWTADFKKTSLHFNYNRIVGATGQFEKQFIGNSDYIGYSPAATSLTYGGKTYLTNNSSTTAANVEAVGDPATSYKVYVLNESNITNNKKIGNKTSTWTVHNAFEAYE